MDNLMLFHSFTHNLFVFSTPQNKIGGSDNNSQNRRFSNDLDDRLWFYKEKWKIMKNHCNQN